MKFINFYGDSVRYEELSIVQYQSKGGLLQIGSKKYSSHHIQNIIHIPFNKGYKEEKLIKTLFPKRKLLYDNDLKVWLIPKL